MSAMPLAAAAANAFDLAVQDWPVKALFHVTGPADPGLLPRLVEPMAKLGLVPTRVHASSESGDGSELSVELRVGPVPPPSAARLVRALRAVVGVRHVIAVVEAVRA